MSSASVSGAGERGARHHACCESASLTHINAVRHSRICPGKELADASIFIAIAQVLAAFNIGKAKDASGNTIEPLYEYTPGVIRCVFLQLAFLLLSSFPLCAEEKVADDK